MTAAAEPELKASEVDGGDDATEEERAVAGKGQIGAVQISERYLLFGLGRHAW